MALARVVYIRKVKKSESKSQRQVRTINSNFWLCISVKLKNLKANHNLLSYHSCKTPGCVYP